MGVPMPTNPAQHRTMSHVVRFDCYEADLGSGELRKRGIRIRLREQSFQVLTALLEHRRQVVTREHLQHLLWQGKVFVDFDNNLNAVVAHLHEVLSDSAEHPRFIGQLA
ncbi:MAG: winged helix-turn-helix domain-containing protein [Terriglobales bacterium]